MLFILFIIACLAFSIISLQWLVRIFITHRWVKKEIAQTRKITFAHKPIYVLIPVLSEVGRIEKTIDYFLKTFAKRINLKLVLITTEAEFTYQQKGPNTIDVCRQLASTFKGSVIHLHYPRSDGRMSHQLNFAIDTLGSAIEPDSLITIYNADSKPHPLTFDWVLQKRRNDSTQHVFQQYGNYTQNITSQTNGILHSAALWQNRWATGFELYKTLRSLKTAHKNGVRRPLNYVIGHGLFLTRELYGRSIGFSEVFHNEDAILGLEISFLKEKIMPLPFFDTSDTPDTVHSLYSQKIHWFFGPYQAFHYAAFLLQKYRRRPRLDKATLMIQTGKLFSHAVYWVFGPSFIVFILLYPFLSGRLQLIIVAYGVFVLFFVIPNYLSTVLFRPGRVSHVATLWALSTGGLSCYVLHGLSALSAVVLSIRRKLLGKTIRKGKTEMRQA